MKWFLQRLWLIKISWDDELPAEVRDNWLELSSELTQLSSLQIPRFMGNIHTDSRLIGFSDALEKAYSVVLYLYTPG